MTINIFITSFYRIEMTLKVIDYIYERTTPGTFKIHIFDNGSDKETINRLMELYRDKRIESLYLNNRNTGCLYNKSIYYAMTEITDKYYCVTDNDIYPPKLNPCWLTQMIDLMEKYPKIGMLAPQLPPQYLQRPYQVEEEIVKCLAVGNTFTIIRRKAFPIEEIMKNNQKLFMYGDDGLISSYMRENGWEVAFCRNIFCYHAGQCENWGYKIEEIMLDPRKKGYGKPFSYKIVNEDTFEPEFPYKI